MELDPLQLLPVFLMVTVLTLTINGSYHLMMVITSQVLEEQPHHHIQHLHLQLSLMNINIDV